MIIVNAKDFGLVSGLPQLQHKHIQAAIDHCFLAGGGEVVISAGKYHIGDIRLRSNITLRLESGAHLMASMDPEDYFNYQRDTIEPLAADQITDTPYIRQDVVWGETEYNENDPKYLFRRLPGSRWNNAIIRAINAKNVKVIGARDAVIDGMNCFDPQGEEYYRGPHGMCFYNCENVELRGYTIQQTGNWAHWLLFSKNIHVEDVQVLAGHDGVDIFSCTNVTITHCEFYTGDDCVAGFGNLNVYVADCEMNTCCSSFRLGGTNVLVERCLMYGPGKYRFRGTMRPEDKAASVPSEPSDWGHMLCAFTYYADYSMPIIHQPGNIVVTDCVFENTERFFHFNFFGNEFGQKYRPLKSIEFKNITASDLTLPIHLYGTEEEKICIKISNSSISFKEGSEPESLFYACNYERITLENIKVLGKLDTLVTKWSDGVIETNNVESQAKTLCENAAKPFSCKPI